jgi:DNA-directed RNA polymerase specialized sigma24 family protein
MYRNTKGLSGVQSAEARRTDQFLGVLSMHDQVTLPRAQLTSLVPPPASPLPCEARGDTAREGGGPVLRFGFSYGRVEKLAWQAVWSHGPTWWLGKADSDRFEAAWGAMAECLYAASEPPQALDLYRAALKGLDELRTSALRDHGYATRKNGTHRDPSAGAMTARSFWRYWTAPPPPAPEDTAVERTAVRQVMAALDPRHARILLALAEHGGDREAAASSLGIAPRTFENRLAPARAAALALWHDHEAPSRLWRPDPRPARRTLRSDPAGDADAARTLADIRRAFGDQTRVTSTDLLSRLAAASPARYGTWDYYDLAGFLRRHDARRHHITVDGIRGSRQRGYFLEEVTAALAELTAPGTLERQAA